MESKVGSILALIGGILTLIGAFAILVASILLISLSSYFDRLINIAISSNSMDQEISSIFIESGLSSISIGLVLLLFFAILLIGGILKIYASNLMRNSRTTLKGGIIAIVLGIVVSDIFSLIGGIFGVVQGNEERDVQGKEKRNVGSSERRKSVRKKR